MKTTLMILMALTSLIVNAQSAPRGGEIMMASAAEYHPTVIYAPVSSSVGSSDIDLSEDYLTAAERKKRAASICFGVAMMTSVVSGYLIGSASDDGQLAAGYAVAGIAGVLGTVSFGLNMGSLRSIIRHNRAEKERSRR